MLRASTWVPAFLLSIVVAASTSAGCGGGSLGDTDDTCGEPVNCLSAAAQSYTSCTSADGATCSLKANDGTVFVCGADCDCSNAVRLILEWCVRPGGTPSWTGSGQ